LIAKSIPYEVRWIGQEENLKLHDMKYELWLATK
jgi:hypothetical protein